MIYFTEDMKTGIAHIDDQHKSLISYVNGMAAQMDCVPTDEQMREWLDFLEQYLNTHLGDEETLQRKIKYPRIRLHREIHREFMQTFESMRREFERYGASRELHQALVSRVSSWIVTHIKLEDRAFGEYYAKKRLDQIKGSV